jgi:hypothetical protein
MTDTQEAGVGNYHTWKRLRLCSWKNLFQKTGDSDISRQTVHSLGLSADLKGWSEIVWQK